MEIEELKRDGKAKGLCRPWQMKLKSGLSVEMLAKLYIKGIDFCISENFPTLSYMKEHYKGRCEPFGIYIDDEDVRGNNLHDVVLNGACKAVLEYDGYSVSRIYARHGADVTVNISGNALLTIDAFDEARVTINAHGVKAKVLVNLYGNSRVESTTGGLIKVTFKYKETY